MKNLLIAGFILAKPFWQAAKTIESPLIPLLL